MKIFHTADWHLGKRIQGVYMTEDQRYILQRFAETVEREKPDAIVIAGDLYDRAVPPADAVELLNEVIEQLVLELETPVIAIAGNHDSPDRLEFGTRLMKARGLHLSGTFKFPIEPVILGDEHGEVHIHPVPYADPAFVRERFGEEEIRTHDDAMRILIQRMTEQLDPRARHVFVGHAFVTPGAREEENTSDAERPLSVGGAEYVAAEHFSPFDYVALGHLHRGHQVGLGPVYYSGSPLKYSVAEAHHHKGFLCVELGASGVSDLRHIPLEPKRDLRQLEGTLEQIVSGEPSDDYIFVTLLDEGPVLYPMEKVRAVYPNVLHIERKITLPANDAAKLYKSVADGKGRPDPVSLFAAFYKEVTDMPLSEEKKRYFEQIYEQTLLAEGERV